MSVELKIKVISFTKMYMNYEMSLLQNFSSHFSRHVISNFKKLVVHIHCCNPFTVKYIVKTSTAKKKEVWFMIMFLAMLK